MPPAANNKLRPPSIGVAGGAPWAITENGTIKIKRKDNKYNRFFMNRRFEW
tara:strand:- start:923 stop:1075 length:153 start_codon:yes stop_codon:yes gene_type:complete